MQMTTTAGFVGNLTADPELRFSNAGKPWATFKLAVKPYPQLEGDQIAYYEGVCFGSLAENVSEQCTKGQRVVVTGRLEEDRWTGRDGIERVTLKIIAEGVGADLRFTTTTKTALPGTPAKREPGTIDRILGPAPERDYPEEPF
jgi:single-strand DNA-binding protein